MEKKWQKAWEEAKIFNTEKSSKKKYYVLEMFPYPSGSGLHMGHAFNYALGDVYARYKLMNGYNVLHPMGYDSLGLPAETAAIKDKTHPEDYTKNSIKNYVKQQKALGISYDWDRMISTADPQYYKWDQWIFAEMYKKGLAYRKKSPVNWCEQCDTVLANEQVHNGKCWRHEDTKVQVKNLSQWFFKITNYAEELNDFSKLKEWPELIKKLQKNWIGKSEGTEILFEINNEKWKIFTTRPDTLFGVTFLVISAQHPKLFDLVTAENKVLVEKFVKTLSSVSAEDIDQLEKAGVFTGSYAIHPLTKEKVPVYAGNFVLAEYGSGMVMAVPAHDQRDYEFAKKYGIPIKEVIVSSEGIKNKAYTGDGKLINSGKFNSLKSDYAKEKITDELQKINKGKKTINYRLRDWLISRQRYWGTPIPIIYCDKCGEVLDEKLPVTLPKKVKFGKGNPLESNKEFVHVKCPSCKGSARRETDTMDTFVNSSWYFLRYTDPQNDNLIFNSENANYWAPVDFYIGGKEHACMHLIYVRFYTKFLRDIGLLNFDEPAIKLFNQGMLHASDGNKMSKSLGNVVNPTDIIKKSSADAVRLFLFSVASPDSDFNWDDKGLFSTQKFLNKVETYYSNLNYGISTPRKLSKINKTIIEITDDIENLKYNLGIIKLRELFDSFESESKEVYEIFLKLLSPFCPHLCEELWERMGNTRFISNSSWPIANKKLIDEKYEIIDMMQNQLRLDIIKVMSLAKISQIKKITLFQSNSWKYQLYDLVNKINSRDVKFVIATIMKTDIKKNGQEAIKLIPKLINGQNKALSKKDETIALNELIDILKNEFKCEIELIDSDKSTEIKANQSLPLKPAILME